MRWTLSVLDLSSDSRTFRGAVEYPDSTEFCDIDGGIPNLNVRNSRARTGTRTIESRLLTALFVVAVAVLLLTGGQMATNTHDASRE